MEEKIMLLENIETDVQIMIRLFQPDGGYIPNKSPTEK